MYTDISILFLSIYLYCKTWVHTHVSHSSSAPQIYSSFPSCYNFTFLLWHWEILLPLSSSYLRTFSFSLSTALLTSLGCSPIWPPSLCGCWETLLTQKPFLYDSYFCWVGFLSSGTLTWALATSWLPSGREGKKNEERKEGIWRNTHSVNDIKESHLYSHCLFGNSSYRLCCSIAIITELSHWGLKEKLKSF